MGNLEYEISRLRKLNLKLIARKFTEQTLLYPNCRDFVWGHHIWSLQGKVQEIECHDSSIDGLAVSPDGQTLASASADKTICIWDLKTQRKIRTLNHKRPVQGVRFMKDPSSLVSLSCGSLHVWDLATGELSFEIGETTEVDCFDCANNEVVFAIGNQVYLFDLATKKTAQLKSFDSDITFIAISKDSKQFVAVRNKYNRTSRPADRYVGFVSVFETKSGKLVLETEKKPGVYSVSFSPDGKTLALGWNKTFLSVDLASGKEYEKRIHTQSITSIEFSADGRQVATATENEIIQWQMFGSHPDRVSFFSPKSRISALAISPDNRTVISSCLGGINFWNAAEHRPERIATGQPIQKLIISKRSADGVVATVTPDGVIEVWDVNNRRQIQTLNPKGRVDRVVFSRSAHWLAVVSGPKLSIWSIPLGRKIKTFQLYDPEQSADNPQSFNEFGSCSFSANDKFLAASWGNRVMVWNVKAGNIVYSHAEHKLDVLAVEFGSDSLLASAGLDETVKIVDVERNKLVATFEGHSAAVRAIAFSPDQQLLISGSDDKNVKVWDLRKNRAIKTIAFHGKPIIDVDFSTDGKCISSASEDNRFAIWNTTEITRSTDLRAPLPRFAARFGAKRTAGFTGDGHSFVASDEKGLLLWRSIQGMDLVTVKIKRPYFVECSPETGTLAVCASDGISIRDSQTGVSIRTLTKSEENWRSIAFSPSGTYLAAVSADDRIRLWSVSDGKLLGNFSSFRGRYRLIGSKRDSNPYWKTRDKYSWTRGFCFSKDEKSLAYVNDTSIVVFDIESGTSYPLDNKGQKFICVAMSPDGKLLAAGGVGIDVSIWDTASKLKVRTLKPTLNPLAEFELRQLTFSDNGREVCGQLSGRDMGFTIFWNSSDGRVGSDGFTKTRALGNSSNFQLFDEGDQVALRKGQCVQLVNFQADNSQMFQHQLPILDFAISESASLIATTGQDGVIKIWDTKTFEKLGTLNGHTAEINKLAFLEDGRTLVSVSDDNTMKIWNTNRKSLANRRILINNWRKTAAASGVPTQSK